MNNYDDTFYFWSGKNNDYIEYTLALQHQEFANVLGLTRSTNCYPQRIRVLGLITDYEIGGILESTEIPLLDKLINSWEHVKQMELKMEGQFIGYRGYTVQMSKGVSSANCIHIEGINFMATKQLHCLYNHNEVEIGDVVRTSCGAGMMGVRTQECVRTITGAKLSEMVSYCRMRFQPVSEIGTFSAPRNHAMLWATVTITSLSNAYAEKAQAAVTRAVREYLEVREENVNVYYVYTRKGSELFYQKELYLEVEIPLLRSNATYTRAVKEVGEMEKRIANGLNREAVVRITKIGFKVDNQILRILVVVVPAVLVVMIVVITILVARRKRKESLEKMYLLA